MLWNDFSGFTIFGSPLFSVLLPHEIVHKSKNQVIIHLFSHKRISKLFTFGGLSACNFQNKKLNTYNYCVGAKVNMTVKGKGDVVGYVIDENANKLIVRMIIEDGKYEIVEVDRPVYDEIRGRYKYPQGESFDSIAISQLNPYRIKLNTKSGQTCFIFTTYNCNAR